MALIFHKMDEAPVNEKPLDAKTNSFSFENCFTWMLKAGFMVFLRPGKIVDINKF